MEQTMKAAEEELLNTELDLSEFVLRRMQISLNFNKKPML